MIKKIQCRKLVWIKFVRFLGSDVVPCPYTYGLHQVGLHCTRTCKQLCIGTDDTPQLAKETWKSVACTDESQFMLQLLPAG